MFNCPKGNRLTTIIRDFVVHPAAAQKMRDHYLRQKGGAKDFDLVRCNFLVADQSEIERLKNLYFGKVPGERDYFPRELARFHVALLIGLYDGNPDDDCKLAIALCDIESRYLGVLSKFDFQRTIINEVRHASL